jgi:hypothetical protein
LPQRALWDSKKVRKLLRGQEARRFKICAHGYPPAVGTSSLTAMYEIALFLISVK